MLTAIASWVRRFLDRISSGVTIVIRWGQGVWEGIRDRHLERAGTDPGYRTALASGATALISVVTTSPALAAALGVFLGEKLRASDGRAPRRFGPSNLRDELYDDDSDVLDASRSWMYRH